jgi:chromosomal replication initiator protein
MTITIEADEQETYSVKSLVRAICENFGVEQDLLLGKRRVAFVMAGRHALYYLGYRNTAHTTTTLGDYLDRDHTTILHGLKKCESLMEQNSNYAFKVEQTHLLALQYEIKRRDGLDKLKAEIQEMVERFQMEKLNGL